MDHYYKNIQGWFDQKGVYELAVKKYDTGRFVEIGCWKGRSTSFMGVEVLNSKKNILIDCVDTFKGSAEHKKFDTKNLYEEFCKNIDPIKNVIGKVHVMSSLDAANLYEDLSLDFVFIDASHDEHNVYKDISAWWPKVKIGGTLAGDDYCNRWKGVCMAVDKYFNSTHIVNKDMPPHWYVFK
jgi:predicted O-methyltransferase YrrM